MFRIAYQGQQFPNRLALARHLAPLLGKSVSAVNAALCRYHGDAERVVERIRNPQPAPHARPVVFRGQRFPTREALVDHLAPLSGKTKASLRTLLCRYDGDGERALAPARRPHRPISFEGRVFPHRKALARYLAPRLQRPVQSVEGLLIAYHDDVAAALAARPYRPRLRIERMAPDTHATAQGLLPAPMAGEGGDETD
jgi:hypothetical protein